MSKIGFLHNHNRMRLKEGEMHSVVDEHERLEAIRLIKELQAKYAEAQELIAEIRDYTLPASKDWLQRAEKHRKR